MLRAMSAGALVLLVLVLAAVLAPAAAQPNLLLNGGFEVNGFQHWTLGSGCNADNVVCKPDLAHSGSCVAQLGSSGSMCALSQAVALSSGEEYELSFYLSSSEDAYSPFTVTAQIGTGPVQTLLALSYVIGSYQHYTFILTVPHNSGSKPKLQLTFDSEDDDYFLYLDDVVLNRYFPPPPPAATRFLTNGGFETGTFFGWTIGPDCTQSDQVQSGYPHSGQFSAFFDNYPQSCTLSQDVTLLKGRSYLFSFWLLYTYDYYYSAQFSLSTELGNTTQLLFSQNGGFYYAYTYYQYSYVVTAPHSGGHTLGLTFAGDGQYTQFYLDDVSLVLLPKGSTGPTGASSAIGIAPSSTSAFNFTR